MRSLIILAFLLFASSSWAANCSFSNPTACGSPGMNNLAVGGNQTIGGTLGVSSATTLSSTLNVSGTITQGTGTNTIDFVQGSAGNWRFDLGSVSSVLNIKVNGGNSLFQINTGGQNESLLPLLSQPTVAISGSSATSNFLGAFNAGSMTGTWSGTTTLPLLGVANATDSVALSNSGAYIAGFASQLATGGASMQGNRVSGFFLTSFNSQSNNKTAGFSNIFYGALAATVQVHATDGGTNLTATGSYGNFFTFNPVAHAFSGATNLHGFELAELDIEADSGSSMRQKYGFNFVQMANDAVQAGAPDNDGVEVISNTQTAVGWRDFGYAYGSPYSYWPFNSSAALVKAYRDVSGSSTSQAKWGVDMAMATFPSTGNAYDGGFFRTQGASLDGAGMLRLGTTYFTPGSTGLSINAVGAIGTTATVNAGGSNWSVGLYATDPYGGMWIVATVSGSAAATITNVIEPTYPSTTTPSNPVTLTAYGTGNIDAGATGLTANISWNTTANLVQLNPAGAVTLAKPILVGSLPSCTSGLKGQIYTVTDASAPTYGSTLSGSGSVEALALCDGSNWKAH